MAMLAQHVTLRIMSQTPVEGAEEARCLKFDHNGLMWIGTDLGVCAYDGYRFRTYRNDAYSPGILPNNYVLRITEAPEDRLWLGTRDGLTCFDRRRNTFRSYRLRSQNARMIDALFTSSDGTIWVGTSNGVSRYDAETDEFTDISMTAGVRSFSEDKKGNIYIGTWEGGLFRLNPKSGKLVSYPQLSERNTVQSQLVDSRGRLWIGTWENGIIRLDHPENESNPGIHRINEGRRDFRTFHQLVEDMPSGAAALRVLPVLILMTNKKWKTTPNSVSAIVSLPTGMEIYGCLPVIRGWFTLVPNRRLSISTISTQQD